MQETTGCYFIKKAKFVVARSGERYQINLVALDGEMLDEGLELLVPGTSDDYDTTFESHGRAVSALFRQGYGFRIEQEYFYVKAEAYGDENEAVCESLRKAESFAQNHIQDAAALVWL